VRSIHDNQPVLVSGTKAARSLADLFAESAKFTAEMKRIRRDLDGGPERRAAAAARDRDAAAIALRKGEPDPGRRNEDAEAISEQDLRRKFANLRAAADLVEHDLAKLLRDKGADLAADARAHGDGARAERQRAVQALIEASTMVAELDDLERWLTSAGETKVNVAPMITLPGRPDGEYRIGEVLDALAAMDDASAGTEVEVATVEEREPAEVEA